MVYDLRLDVDQAHYAAAVEEGEVAARPQQHHSDVQVLLTDVTRLLLDSLGLVCIVVTTNRSLS